MPLYSLFFILFSKAAIGSLALDTARRMSPPDPEAIYLGKQVGFPYFGVLASFECLSYSNFNMFIQFFNQLIMLK